MRAHRRSYSGLMRLPGWGLYDAAEGLVATVAAESAYEARDVFRRHGMTGVRVRRLPNPGEGRMAVAPSPENAVSGFVERDVA